MTVTRIRLFDGTRETVLGGRDFTRDDILVHKINLGSPAVRAVSEDRTNADGTYDTTRHHGGRVVEMVATIWSATLLAELAGWLHPRMRPMLGITDTDWPGGERFAVLRRDNFAPGDISNLSHLRRPLQFQWACPSGLIESTEPVSFELSAEADTTTGRTYPLVFPRVYPVSAGTGQVLHTNIGTTWSDQVVRLYGPCHGPRYTNDSTGETISFSEELVVAAGEYVEVDTLRHTALYLSDPQASRTNFLDWSISTWWQIPPGQSAIRYHPVSEVDAGCGSVTTYRPAYLDV